MLRTLAIASLLAMTITTTATANIIGVGLDWRTGIYVQEIWHAGKPQYLLANLSKKDVQITVHEFDSTWRLGQPLPKTDAGPWKIAAGSQSVVDPKALAGDKLYRFVVEGKTPLGVLPGVNDPGYQGKGYASQLGLNGSGGSVPGVYLEQPELKLAAGAPAKVILHLPGKCGTLKFPKMPEKNADPLRPTTLTVESAASDTLNITSDDKSLIIDTESPKADAASHEVTLTIQIPAVEAPQLSLLDGWLMNKMGGGNGITRGLLVEGKK